MMPREPVWITGVGLATTLGLRSSSAGNEPAGRPIGNLGGELVQHGRLSQQDRGRAHRDPLSFGLGSVRVPSSFAPRADLALVRAVGTRGCRPVE